MEIVRQAFLFVHLVAFASLLGHYLAQVREQTRRVNQYMLYASLVMLGTGILLVALRETVLDDPVNHAKIGIKLGVVLVIAVLAYVGWRRADGGRIFMSIGMLTMANVGVAVFWS